MKTIFLSATLILAAIQAHSQTTGENVSPAAAQTCYQMPGELRLISAEAGGEVDSQADMNEIDGDLMENLNENAQKACLGRQFCVENSGMTDEVTTTGKFKVDVSIKRTAIVNCLK